jgi:hypothetical protein
VQGASRAAAAAKVARTEPVVSASDEPSGQVGLPPVPTSSVPTQGRFVSFLPLVQVRDQSRGSR